MGFGCEGRERNMLQTLAYGGGAQCRCGRGALSSLNALTTAFSLCSSCGIIVCAACGQEARKDGGMYVCDNPECR